MRNLKKLTAVLLAVVFAVSLMVPSFAEAGGSAGILADLDILRGTGDGVTPDYLASSPTRYQAARMFLRLKGLEAEAIAYAGTDNFSDVDGLSAENKAMLAYLKDNPELGFLGYDDGTFKPLQVITAAELYKVLLTAMGYTQGTDFEWADVKTFAESKGLSALYNKTTITVDDFAIGVVEALKAENGKMTKALVDAGKLDGTKAAEKGLYTPTTITTVVNPADVPVAIGGTPELPAVVSVELSDGSTKEVAVTWEAVDTSVAATIPVEGDLAGYTEKATVNVIVSPEVVTATASQSNYKEVVVTLSKELDATEGVDADNYEVKLGSTVTAVNKIKLSEDKKTATLTLDTAMAQQTKVTVKVKKKAGSYPEDVTAEVASAFDGTVPVVEDIKITGPDTFDIIFAEPVQDTGSVEIDNGAIGATPTLDVTKRVLSVKASKNLEDGVTYKVVVKDYEDYAGFKMVSKTWAEFAFVKDTTAPTASIKSAKQLKVVVKFDKGVGINGTTNELTKDYFYHTYTGWKPDTVTANAAKTEYTLTFETNSLQPGDVTVTVLKNSGNDKVKDAWGNEMAADAKLPVVIEPDVTPPSMDAVTYKAQTTTTTTLEVTVSEKVTDFGTDDLVVLDKDDKEVSASIASTLNVKADTGEKVYTFVFGKSLSGGDYKLKIKKDAVMDVDNKVANKNAEKILPFTVTDKLKPTVSSAVYIQNNGAAAADVIYVTYNEAMNQSAELGGVLNKANYMFKGAALGANDKVEPFGTDGKVVKITIADPDPAQIIGANDLVIGQVEDASENKTEAFQTTPTLTPASAPTISSAKFTGLNKMTIVFDKLCSTPKIGDVTVTKGVYTNTMATIDSVVDKDGKTTIEVTLKVDSKLANEEASKSVATDYTVGVKTSLKSHIGKAVVTDDAAVVAPTDAVKPTVDTVTLTRTSATQATVAIKYKETLAATPKVGTGTSLFAEDYSVTAGSTTYVANNDFTAAIAGMTVTLTITDSEADLDALIGTKFTVTSTGVKYVQDTNGNLVSEIAGKDSAEKLTAD
jgi:hypothetical protein